MTAHPRAAHAMPARGPRAPKAAAAGPGRDDLRVSDLVARARCGETQAWNALIARYSPLIWSICRKHQLDGADAEDVGQSVWLKLVEHLDRVREPAALPGWLATTARRECLRVLSSARGARAAADAPDFERIPDSRARTAEQELLAVERLAAVRSAFMALHPDAQTLIALLMEDPPLPYAEISARLDIPVGSIGPMRGRYLDKLRRNRSIAALISSGSGAAHRNQGQAVA